MKGVLLQKCHSILWTPSKLVAKNHIEVFNKKITVNDPLADSSVNIAFNFAEKKELKINWLVRDFVIQSFFFAI